MKNSIHTVDERARWRKLRRSVSASIATVALAGGLAACAPGDANSSGSANGEDAEETISLTLQTYVPGNVSYGVAVDTWADQIREETNGRLDIEVLHDGSLFSVTEIRDALSDGRLDMGLYATTYYAGEYPLTSINELPFMTENVPAQMAVFNDLYENDPQYAAEFNDQGVRLMSYMGVPISIATAKDPFDSIDYFSGKSIRALALGEALRAVPGANPVPLPNAEIYEALQTGMIDMVANNVLDVSVSLSFDEITPNFVDMGTGLWADVLLAVNPDVWEGLPDDIRETVEAANAEFPSILIDAQAETETAACEALLEGGGTATRWPDSSINEWKTLVGDTMKDEWIERATSAGVEDPQGFYDKYVDLLEQYESEYSDYVPGFQQCVERSSD